MAYEKLDNSISESIIESRKKGEKSSFAFCDENAIRRRAGKDIATAIRTPFIRDTDKILHCPFYNRYADKTQVFSFYKNDDISRRGLHVQLVSRIARTLGDALRLNCDLIEAIALGHDIGHTPFGHAGESFLDKIYFERTGKHFAHNIHSVQVLDKIFPYNITLQTLNGIAAHNGELELSCYKPVELDGFSELDKQIEQCYINPQHNKKLMPCTLEGCVVRISDIIAYLGKDRQDNYRTHNVVDFEGGVIGNYNAEIINNLTVNIINNSYGKPYIKMDEEHFAALKAAKDDNYKYIYNNAAQQYKLKDTVLPMMKELFDYLSNDFQANYESSVMYKHHVKYINNAHYERDCPYEDSGVYEITRDFIAAMTDDYFVDLHKHLFPKSKYEIKYIGYFD